MSHDPDAPDFDHMSDEALTAYLASLPELTPEERAAMNAIPADFIDRLLRGEHPLTDPTTFAN
jgi:hypothetical protein